MPLPLTRHRVERQHAVAEQIRALPEAAVEIISWRSCGHEYPAALFIDGHAAPGVRTTIVLARHEPPCVVASLALARDGVEDPFQLSADCIISADVTRRGVVAFVNA